MKEGSFSSNVHFRINWRKGVCHNVKEREKKRAKHVLESNCPITIYHHAQTLWKHCQEHITHTTQHTYLMSHKIRSTAGCNCCSTFHGVWGSSCYMQSFDECFPAFAELLWAVNITYFDRIVHTLLCFKRWSWKYEMFL